jgi:hypothetical protein
MNVATGGETAANRILKMRSPLLHMRLSKDAPLCAMSISYDDRYYCGYRRCSSFTQLIKCGLSLFLPFLIVIDEKRINIGPNQL